MGNSPRMDPEDMHGYITDVAIKRRIRNYIQAAFEGQDGMSIIMQNATNINKYIAKAKEDAGVDVSAKDKKSIYAARQEACSKFYDVRTFGAVLSTGPNSGQVRGPVQIAFARSLDPILPLDISITRMAVSDGDKDKDSEYYTSLEADTPEDKLRTMGRKQFLSYGLYEARGFISANLAAETGFDDADLKALFEAILNMYEHDRSASKGEMSVISPLIVFRHTGTDSDEKQRARQAKLGCAPAHKLFELVNISKKADVELARSYRDYNCKVRLSAVPKGVEVGFLNGPYGNIVWGKLPDENDWLKGE
ncbi:MAG: type I-C CRISPR-associated protein Cas7/Csd2 [Ruminococcus sp.]|nr:type I-C CRISPR-associated protein Cas7/Csd2 [Ruminococcus sp.]